MSELNVRAGHAQQTVHGCYNLDVTLNSLLLYIICVFYRRSNVKDIVGKRYRILGRTRGS